jgi:AcrR family transcriptional regulator
MSTKRAYRMVRRQERADATRARLLDAAWAAFSSLPYESVRLADVADDAGVSVQTLHTNFGTKEELFTVALQRWMGQQGSARVDARVGDVDDIVRVLYDNYDDQGAVGLRIIAQEDRIPEVHAFMELGRRWQRIWVATVFEPYLSAASPKRAREDLLDALIVACDILTWRLLRVEMGHSPSAARRIVRGMVDALVNARVAPPGAATTRARP